MVKQCGLSNQKMFIMECKLIFQEGDLDIVRDYLTDHEDDTKDQLINAYNKEVEKGITGDHQQALQLCGLRILFNAWFDDSPIKLDEESLTLRLSGLIEKDGEGFRYLEKEKYEEREITDFDLEWDTIDFGNIHYSDHEKQKVIFSTLLINVNSITRVFGTLREFTDMHMDGGVTNGKLILMAELRLPPYELMDFAEECLVPNGLIENKDYVFVREGIVIGVGGEKCSCIGKSIPECENIDWLGSEISEDGYFVWHKH